MKTSSIAVETSRSTTQSDSIVRQTNKRSSYLPYTTMNNKHIFNDKVKIVANLWWWNGIKVRANQIIFHTFKEESPICIWTWRLVMVSKVNCRHSFLIFLRWSGGCTQANYPAVRKGSSNTHFFPCFFFGWSLAPDFQFSLGQRNTRRVFRYTAKGFNLEWP